MTERRSLGSYALLALVAGLALGLFSGLGDWVPADTVLHVVVALANAAGPWLVTAFMVADTIPMPRPDMQCRHPIGNLRPTRPLDIPSVA